MPTTEFPTFRNRFVVSFAISIVAGILFFRQYTSPDFHTDFGMSWFGARSLLHHIDPYPLVGPGREFNFGWPLTYPAASLVAFLPLSFFSERIAGTIFVAVSVFALALGITRKGWYLMPIFMTEPFLNAVRLGQWNIALAAAIYFPLLAFLFPVKPQAAVPILAASSTSKTWAAALAGSIVLLLVSFALLPHWPVEWLEAIRQMPDSRPPITRFGGFLVLIVLLRWRRPESWLILGLACVPQTPAFYSALPLFTIPATFIEAMAVALISAIGVVIGSELIPRSVRTVDAFQAYIGSVQIWTIYLPVVILVLRRPPVDTENPAWLRALISQDHSRQPRTTVK